MASNGVEPARLHVTVGFEDSSSPQSTALSSDSPGTATSLCFSVTHADSPCDFERDVVPKIEDTEDDCVDHEDTKTLPSPPEDELDCNGDVKEEKEKKKRGRPRKYPRDVGPPKPAAKGRSKTGCFTCRRRKKKCDESKPSCKHCEKNNLQCEGYPQKQVWRSGKQRASMTRRLSTEQFLPLPPIFEGIKGMERDETHHKFFDNVSEVLGLYPAGQNSWVDTLLPMATKHTGLMHSVLCLSGTHLLALEPSNRSYKERREHHYGEALRLLRQNKECMEFCNGDANASVDDATIAQCVVMHLASVADSRPGERYEIFSRTARDLFKAQKASDPGFRKFLNEFFLYHDACNSITSVSHQPLSLENFQLPEYMLPKEASTYLGVMNDVFPSISSIKGLRDRMRQRWAEGLNVDTPDWSLAAKIEADLGASVCKYEGDDGPRKVASMLYHTVTWLYLHRTINQPDDQLKMVLETGLRYYRLLSEEGSTLSVLLMPLFLLGCSAFWPEHRGEISEGFDNLQAYSNLGNILNAKAVVEEVWKYMDAGDARCWDWEAIMMTHGWDFLIT